MCKTDTVKKKVFCCTTNITLCTLQLAALTRPHLFRAGCHRACNLTLPARDSSKYSSVRCWKNRLLLTCGLCISLLELRCSLWMPRNVQIPGIWLYITFYTGHEFKEWTVCSECLNQMLLSGITAGYSAACRIDNECPFFIIMRLLWIILLCYSNH